ncbi:unnamed protein product [Rotaria sp. Silwood2]|nr:unnamed protein product [Rotaria sp. Silwood2]CAF2528166.1 unnamed protein product [Rotaria sp. Silwood2]CAF2938277.1 unnamed protein product [Rotaria sp. Silwood2]
MNKLSKQVLPPSKAYPNWLSMNILKQAKKLSKQQKHTHISIDNLLIVSQEDSSTTISFIYVDLRKKLIELVKRIIQNENVTFFKVKQIHRNRWFLTAVNRAYNGIQSRFININHMLRVYTLGFYADISQVIQDILRAGIDTFNQVMFTEVISPDGVFKIITRYLRNRPSRKSMMRIHKGITKEELVDVRAVIMILIYFGIILLFAGFSFYMYANYLRARNATRERKLNLSKLRRAAYAYDTESSSEICAVCREEYQADEQIYKFPCSHVLHVRCTDTWVVNDRQSCPLCRRDLFFTQYPPDEGSDERRADSYDTNVCDETHTINVSSGLDDNDEPMHSTLPDETNQADIPNRTSTD